MSIIVLGDHLQVPLAGGGGAGHNHSLYLRDAIAIDVMLKLIEAYQSYSLPGVGIRDQIATQSYQMADAMMKARLAGHEDR